MEDFRLLKEINTIKNFSNDSKIQQDFVEGKKELVIGIFHYVYKEI